MKSNMYLKLIVFVGAIFLTSINIHAQARDINGKILDKSTNEPIIGANVIVKETMLGTISNEEGGFTIKADENATLIISYIGYITQVINTGTSQTLNILLEPDLTQLEDVVVIGYGTVKKTDATGAISTVGAKDFNKGALVSVQEQIMGKTAGLVVTTHSGAPGAATTIRIRGGSSLRASNDPLIVIDGFPLDNSEIKGISNPLSTINPNDIESVTVLKDASATAIYGSRASNGVIIITTKKGIATGPLKIRYTTNVSLGTPTKLLEVLDGDEFRAVIADRVANHGLSKVALTKLGKENTDWQKEIYQNAFSMDHNLSFTGNVAKMPFRASFGYTDQNGLLKNSNMGRSTIDLSASPSFFDKHLLVNMNLKGTKSNHNFSNTDAIGGAVQFDPTQPIKNNNTRYGGYTAWTETDAKDSLNGRPNNIATHNPVARLKYRDNKSEVYRSIGNMQIDYKFHFLPDLHANLNAGYDYSHSEGHDNIDSLASWSYREPERNLTSYSQTLNTKLLELYLTYDKKLDAIHSKINIVGGYTWQHFYREGENANCPWVKTKGVYKSADTTQWKNENYLVSFIGRINYSLLDRYLLTFSLRDDGSSRFSPKNRWGLFPSAAFAWKIKSEPFLANIKAISEMKLRLGYGVTGQQNILNNEYPYQAIYTSSKQGAYYQFGDKFYSTWRPDPYDKDIQWEETTTKNIGLDFGLFSDKIVCSLDIYERKTAQLLNEVPAAAGTNFSNEVVTNVGSMKNTGFEASLTLRPVTSQNFNWQIGTTFTMNKNEITKLTNGNTETYTGYETGGISGGVGNNVQINTTGQPINTFYLFKQIVDANNKPIEGLYFDKTGNGGTVSGDNKNKYYMGQPTPDYIVTIASRLDYKDIDFSFSGRMNVGNLVYNNNASNMALYQNVYNQSGYTSNILTDVYKTNFETAQFWSDFYLEDASFFKMDYISLGYSFKNLITNKLNGRLSFTVQNAFTITQYSGIDPDINGGIDNNIFPRPRTYVVGLNFEF